MRRYCGHDDGCVDGEEGTHYGMGIVCRCIQEGGMDGFTYCRGNRGFYVSISKEEKEEGVNWWEGVCSVRKLIRFHEELTLKAQ